MKKHLPRLAAFCFMAISVAAFAQDKARSDKTSKWQKMDVNKDGMISKDEYMKYQEGQWNTWKKNKDGMVDLRDVKQAPKKKAKSNGEAGANGEAGTNGSWSSNGGASGKESGTGK